VRQAEDSNIKGHFCEKLNFIDVIVSNHHQQQHLFGKLGGTSVILNKFTGFILNGHSCSVPGYKSMQMVTKLSEEFYSLYLM
jgi:hypothetical protein